MKSASCAQASTARPLPSIQYLPIGFFGAVMSVAGLSLAWRLASKEYGADIAVSKAIGVFALSMFAVLTLSYLVKLFRYPNLVRHEFSHPVIGSFFGTFGISLLLLSSVIASYNSAAQLVVWAIGTVVTLVLTIIMISRLLNGNAAPASIVPALLIGGVGSLDIVVTGAGFTAGWAHEVNLLAAAIGGVSAIVFFILIFSRMIHHEPLAGAMQPSQMILVAPFSVGFIAYVNLVQKVDMFAALLFYFGLFLFVIILYRLLAKPAVFSLNWWAIGFPMAALTIAALMYSNSVESAALEFVAAFLLFLLTASIIVLTVRTAHALVTGRILNA